MQSRYTLIYTICAPSSVDFLTTENKELNDLYDFIALCKYGVEKIISLKEK